MSSKKCQVRVSFTKNVSSKSVLQECQVRVSSKKGVLQECHLSVSRQGVPQVGSLENLISIVSVLQHTCRHSGSWASSCFLKIHRGHRSCLKRKFTPQPFRAMVFVPASDEEDQRLLSHNGPDTCGVGSVGMTCSNWWVPFPRSKLWNNLLHHSYAGDPATYIHWFDPLFTENLTSPEKLDLSNEELQKYQTQLTSNFRTISEWWQLLGWNTCGHRKETKAPETPWTKFSGTIGSAFGMRCTQGRVLRGDLFLSFSCLMIAVSLTLGIRRTLYFESMSVIRCVKFYEAWWQGLSWIAPAWCEIKFPEFQLGFWVFRWAAVNFPGIYTVVTLCSAVWCRRQQVSDQRNMCCSSENKFNIQASSTGIRSERNRHWWLAEDSYCKGFVDRSCFEVFHLDVREQLRYVVSLLVIQLILQPLAMQLKLNTHEHTQKCHFKWTNLFWMTMRTPTVCMGWPGVGVFVEFIPCCGYMDKDCIGVQTWSISLYPCESF